MNNSALKAHGGPGLGEVSSCSAHVDAIGVPAASLPIQLLANGLEKATEDVPVFVPLPPSRETRTKLLASA